MSMLIHQLSLFVENRPGQINARIQLLARAGIDLRTLTLADTKDFGILRLIVSDWRRAKAVLEAGGHVVKVTEVVALEVPDRPGGLSEVLAVLDARQIGIEYMYAFAPGRAEDAVMVFRFDRPAEAVAALQEAGLNVVGSEGIRQRLGERREE
jgi:hypothetical protein